MARAYRDRDEHDRLKQQRMVDYSEHRGCRWDYLVNYFGKDDVEADSLRPLRPLRPRSTSRRPNPEPWADCRTAWYPEK